jgi:hypothetical protein
MGELLFYRTHRRASIPFEENYLKFSKWHLLMNGSLLSTHFSSLRPGMCLRRFCILLATSTQTSLSRIGSEVFRDFFTEFRARACISALHCVRPSYKRCFDFMVPRLCAFLLQDERAWATVIIAAGKWCVKQCSSATCDASQRTCAATLRTRFRVLHRAVVAGG